MNEVGPQTSTPASAIEAMDELLCSPDPKNRALGMQMLKAPADHISALLLLVRFDPTHSAKARALLEGEDTSHLPIEAMQEHNDTYVRVIFEEGRRTAIDAAIKRNIRHGALKFEGAKLAELPAQLAEHCDLLFVYLRGTLFTELPPLLLQFKRLRHLDLHRSQLKSLPDALFDLEDLMCIEVRRNLLTGIPPRIARLKNLRTLDLRHNKLTSLPAELLQMKCLQRLKIGHNPMPSEEVNRLYFHLRDDCDDSHVRSLWWRLVFADDTTLPSSVDADAKALSMAASCDFPTVQKNATLMLMRSDSSA